MPKLADQHPYQQSYKRIFMSPEKKNNYFVDDSKSVVSDGL